MQPNLQITILSFSLIILGVVWGMIRHGQLRPAYGLLWLIGAILFFLFSLFTGLVQNIANFFEVSYAPTVVIGFALIFIIVLLLSQSVIISNLSRHNRDFAQNIAILEWRLENLEKQGLATENHL